MSTTTSGQISITPVRILTTASLEAVAGAIADARYEGEAGTRGWGSVRDETDKLVGQVARSRPRGGPPEPVIESDNYPRQLRARLYWDEPDRTLERAFGLDSEVASTTRFQAADITIAESTTTDGELLGLLGERNDRRLNGFVVPEVRDALESVDPSATIIRDDNPLAFGDDDFFRWVLYRQTHDPVLNEDLTISAVRAMSNQDTSYRPTSMSRGLALDRPELLALLAGTLNKFGPAKIIVYSSNLGLTASLEVTANGQFSIYRGASEYDVDIEGEEMTHEEEGMKLLQDTAFEVIPELKRLHNADFDWLKTNRAAFTQEARDLLQGVLDAL